MRVIWIHKSWINAFFEKMTVKAQGESKIKYFVVNL